MLESSGSSARARRNWLLLGATAGLLLLDRVTKLVAIATLADQPGTDYLGGFLRLIYQENRGAMLSLGAGLPESIRFLFFTVLVALVLVAILLFALLKRTLTVKDALAAALVIGGGLGNVIDRLIYNGAVLDFLNVGIGDLRTGVFNVADVAILAGLVVYVVGPKGEPPTSVRTEVRSPETPSAP